MKRLNPHRVLHARNPELNTCVTLYANTPLDLHRNFEEAHRLLDTLPDGNDEHMLLGVAERFLRVAALEDMPYPVAFFLSEHMSGFVPLPYEVKSLAVVSTSFHVKPLLKWLQREHRFLVLLLKDNEATIHEGTLGHFGEMETISYKQLGSRRGILPAIDRRLFRAVYSLRTPVILAGDFDMIEDFRVRSRYKHLVEDPIINPDDFENPDKLHKAAIEVLEPLLKKQEEAHLNAYWHFQKKDRTVFQLDDIVHHALRHRIKHIFICEDVTIWGEINPLSEMVRYNQKQMDAYDDDIIDDLAEMVYRAGGQITVLPRESMPHNSATCAILRKSPEPLRELSDPIMTTAYQSASSAS